MEHKLDPDFWLRIKPGSIVTLSDEQAINDSMEAGDGARGIDYTAKTLYRIKELNDLAIWLMIELEGTEQNLWMMVKIVDQDLGLRIYYEPDEFEPSDRADMIDRGDFWLFKEPEDPDNIEPGDLSYTYEIEHSIEQDGEERHIVFRQKAQGEMHGECKSKPKLSGMNEMLATVVEYSTQEECENPELLILEIGGADSRRGGCIRLMLGADINASEVDVLGI